MRAPIQLVVLPLRCDQRCLQQSATSDLGIDLNLGAGEDHRDEDIEELVACRPCDAHPNAAEIIAKLQRWLHTVNRTKS